MPAADAPALAGIHHLKLPVTDLARSLEWYRSRLGYDLQAEFVEHALRFYTMEHHTDMSPGGITTIHDPRETAERREREAAERSL